MEAVGIGGRRDCDAQKKNQKSCIPFKAVQHCVACDAERAVSIGGGEGGCTYGLRARLRWGVEMEAEVFVDSSAAVGVTQRRGNGKLRHVKVGMLWIQEKSEEGELEFNKIEGDKDPADMMIKNLTRPAAGRHMEVINQHAREGRAAESLNV